MPSKKEVFMCDVCDTEYYERDLAVKCENDHPSKDKFTFKAAIFQNLKGTYGLDRGIAQKMPIKIVVRFGPEYGNFATYTRTRIGPKGL